MAIDWFYSRQGERFGPLSPEELKSLADTGQLLRSDLLWRQGMGRWVPAASFPGLFTHGIAPMSGSPILQTDPDPLADLGTAANVSAASPHHGHQAQHGQHGAKDPSAHGSHSKKSGSDPTLWWMLGVLVVALVIGVIIYNNRARDDAEPSDQPAPPAPQAYSPPPAPAAAGSTVKSADYQAGFKTGYDSVMALQKSKASLDEFTNNDLKDTENTRDQYVQMHGNSSPESQKYSGMADGMHKALQELGAGH